jgi:hypothetical protein
MSGADTVGILALAMMVGLAALIGAILLFERQDRHHDHDRSGEDDDW